MSFANNVICIASLAGNGKVNRRRVEWQCGAEKRSQKPYCGALHCIEDLSSGNAEEQLPYILALLCADALHCSALENHLVGVIGEPDPISKTPTK